MFTGIANARCHCGRAWVWMAATEQKTQLLAWLPLISRALDTRSPHLAATQRRREENNTMIGWARARIMPCCLARDNNLDPIPSALTSHSWHGDYPTWIVGWIKNVSVCARARANGRPALFIRKQKYYLLFWLSRLMHACAAYNQYQMCAIGVCVCRSCVC